MVEKTDVGIIDALLMNQGIFSPNKFETMTKVQKSTFKELVNYEYSEREAMKACTETDGDNNIDPYMAAMFKRDLDGRVDVAYVFEEEFIIHDMIIHYFFICCVT